jgi:hypothetical protein
LEQEEPVGQTWPQPPQLLLLELRSTQALPQMVSPVGHWHAPLPQVAPGGQTLLQAPQLLTSTARSLQTPLQQLRPVWQTWPQAPQLLMSVPVLVHAPLQSVWPEGQLQTPLTQLRPVEQAGPAPHWHFPAKQLSAAVAEQTLPQPPQLLTLVSRLAQVPRQQVWPDRQQVMLPFALMQQVSPVPQHLVCPAAFVQVTAQTHCPLEQIFPPVQV